jgi:murein DD-endopeptidase MepM/ murein hydrolase activator NlpD
MLGLVGASIAPHPAGAAPVAPAPGPMPVLPPPVGFPVPAPPAADAPVPPPLDWLTAAKTEGRAVTAEHGATEQLVAAKAAVRRAQRAVGAARAHRGKLQRRAAAARARIARLDHERAVTLKRERDRAVRAYIDGNDAILIADVLSAPSITDQARRAIYANAGQTVDAQNVRDLELRRGHEQGMLDALVRAERRAAHALVVAGDRLTEASKSLLVLTAVTTDAAHGGRVFPVDGPFEFDDSWGAFRADLAIDTHTHGHDATDIMAAGGTPVVAVESGTLDRVGWNTLGGWRLWITGVSGTTYYYAHLSSYAPNLMDTVPVVAGQYLGTVGNTGNAAGGPTHLHFEVHLPDAAAPAPPPNPAPDPAPQPAPDGIVVNPYPLLCLLAGAPIPVIPPPDPLPPPDPPPTSTTLPGRSGP